MHLSVEKELEGIGNTLQRDGDRFRLVRWDGNLKVLDIVLLHEGDVLGRVLLRNECAILLVSTSVVFAVWLPCGMISALWK